MTSMSTSLDQHSWINSFDPKKRIFVGRSYFIIKRIIDLTLVLLSAPFWAPLLLVIGIIIKVTSPGAPALFTQFRTGKN